MTIYLPKMIYMNTALDTQIKLLKSVTEDEEVYLSFRDVAFILPATTILLISLSKQIYMMTKTPVIWSEMKEDIRTYMERIRINDLKFVVLPKTNLLRKRNKTNSLVEMKIMENPSQYDEMVSETKRIMYEWFPGRYADEYVKQITGYIKDIAANSLEHSEENGKGICYFTLQKYNPPKSKMSIHVAFGDTGMGISNSLAKKYPWVEQINGRPIVRAFIDGLSCRGNENGGLGFRMIKKQLRDYGGEIQIRSGKEMIRYFGNGKYRTTDFKQSIVGTQTLFILN